MTTPAAPFGFRDGLGGALALLADQFSEAELARLRGRYAVVEHVAPVRGTEGDIEGWLPTRWPLECDAALATLAARLVSRRDPALQEVLVRLRDGCSREALRRLAGLAPDSPNLGGVVSSEASRALARAHLLLPLTSYEVHRSLPCSAAVAAAFLLRLALTADGLTTARIIETVLDWAPVAEHRARTTATHLMTATWPGFAVLLDGAVERTLPEKLAEALATARSVDDGEARFQRLTQALTGAGLIAAVGDEAVVLRRGTVLAWSVEGTAIRRITTARERVRGETWALGAGAVDEGALSTASRAPIRRLVERLLPAPAPGLSELFFGPRTSSSRRPEGAVAVVRPPARPAPTLAPDPVEIAQRQAEVEVLVREVLRDTRGLEGHVSVAGDAGTNGALERVGVLRVTVVRDDVAGASSEETAADALERAIAERPHLAPFEVGSDYIK